MNIFKQTYLGEFIEERDGKKCVVKKWETVKAIPEHNEKIDEQITRLESQKVDESIQVGKVEEVVK